MQMAQSNPAVFGPVESSVWPARTKDDIRKLAEATVREHGMLLVSELKKGDNFDGGNLCALLEVFGEKLLAGDVPPGLHTFGSVMLTALETIATLPLEEQDNMMAANMRHVARTALACRPNVLATGRGTHDPERDTAVRAPVDLKLGLVAGRDEC
jgi:hypothetical protein